MFFDNILKAYMYFWHPTFFWASSCSLLVTCSLLTSIRALAPAAKELQLHCLDFISGQWTRKCGTHGPKPHPPRDKKVSPWAMDTQSDICIGMNSPVQAPMCHTRVVECCRLQDIRCFFSAAPYLQVWLLWLNYIELKPGPLAKPWILVKILTSWSKMAKNLKFWEPLALRVNYIIFYAFLWVVHGQIMGFLRLRFKLRVVYAP